jgi:hypothetical protein
MPVASSRNRERKSKKEKASQQRKRLGWGAERL